MCPHCGWHHHCGWGYGPPPWARHAWGEEPWGAPGAYGGYGPPTGPGERKAALEAAKQHLERRLAELNEELGRL